MPESLGSPDPVGQSAAILRVMVGEMYALALEQTHAVFSAFQIGQTERGLSTASLGGAWKGKSFYFRYSRLLAFFDSVFHDSSVNVLHQL